MTRHSIMSNKAVAAYLYDAVKKIDLAAFVEKVSGTSMSGTRRGWMSKCPMPWHDETKPSFHVARHDNGIWVYHCFGCHSGGTIIDFCRAYFSLEHPYEAMLMVAEQCGVEIGSEMLTKAVTEAKVTIDENKRLECAHFVAASNCRRLLRSRNGDSMKWVADAYWRMNRMLDAQDVAGIDAVGRDALMMIASHGAVRSIGEQSGENNVY